MSLKHYIIAGLFGIALQGCRSGDGTTRDEEEPSGVSFAVAGVPSSFTEAVIADIINPTAMAMAPDGRIFVCQQAGQVRILKGGSLITDPFLSLTVDSEGERGLLGLAFDPDFATTRYVYVYYTVPSPLHNRVSRFTASVSNPDLVEAGSETPLLELNSLVAGNHNGGALQFGADGKLYVAAGDNAISDYAQMKDNLLGKILRINKDGSIPADNPFYATTSGVNRAIWAMGLRNPFTFAIQPGTGRMYINDVGKSTWEEINEGKAGANYGWPTIEGPSTNAAFTAPMLAYSNTVGNGTGPECAIVGAAFYNPASPQFPADYTGDFFFGDHCAGWIKRMDVPGTNAEVFASGIQQLSGLIVGNDGALYYASQKTDQIVKISYSSAASPPQFFQHPKSITVSVDGAASFTAAASGSGSIAYRWQRDKADISGATSPTYGIAAARSLDSGAVFRCIATNAQGSDTSDEATLLVTVNKPPVAQILLPDTAYRYRAGDTLAYSGSAADAEDGSLAAGAFTWQIDFHHGTHSHPFMAAKTGSKSGSAVIPVEGETASDVWLRLYLTVIDSRGLTHQVYRDIQPIKANITLATVPAGLGLALDGSPVTTPYAFTGVTGMRRTIRAATQNAGGKTYEFVSWSDGGAADHAISTPGAATTYTATFREVPPNQPPSAAFTLPDTAFRYQAGNTFTFAATGTDPEDGALPDSAFTWRVDFHHETMIHPLTPLPARARSGSVAVAADNETSTNVFYRIYLTVQDKAGLTFSVTRDVLPLKVSVTLDSKPSGLKLQLDDTAITTPYQFTGVAGIRRSIAAQARQNLGAVVQDFVSWSDSGAISHFILTPSSTATITAVYKDAPISTGIRPGNIIP